MLLLNAQDETSIPLHQQARGVFTLIDYVFIAACNGDTCTVHYKVVRGGNIRQIGGSFPYACSTRVSLFAIPQFLFKFIISRSLSPTSKSLEVK